MLRIPGSQHILSPSRIAPPLTKMAIRFDGITPPSGAMQTLKSPRFGMTRNGGTRPHQGVDLDADVGTPVFAIADGIIERTRLNAAFYGRDIILKFRPINAWIKHLATVGVSDEDGILFAQYAHLSEILVRDGQRVAKGTVIGKTGISGNADQDYPHLHFEIRMVASPGGGLAGRIDPEKFFPVDASKPVDALSRASRTA